MSESLLLVHDDLRATATLRRLLGREGYEVALATSVSDALAACAERKPDLILLAPAVDGGQGKLLIDQLGLPFAKVRLLLLGEAVPGVVAPVAAPPWEGTALIDAIRSLLVAKPRDLFAPLEANLGSTSDTAAAATAPSDVVPRLIQSTLEPSPASPSLSSAVERELRSEVETLQRALTAALARVEDAEGQLASLRPQLDEARHEAVVLAEAAHGAETDISDAQLALDAQRRAFEQQIQELKAQAAAAEVQAAARLQVALLPKPKGWLSPVAPVAGPIPLTHGASALLSEAEQGRLSTKFRQIQEADYFAILELVPPSEASAVHSAYQRLSEEFHPFKYAGLGDSSCLDQAEQIQSILQEAVQALLDDRLRAEYGRHLTPS